MLQSAFSSHCERFEESRSNLKTFLLNFGNRPFRWGDIVDFRFAQQILIGELLIGVLNTQHSLLTTH